VGKEKLTFHDGSNLDPVSVLRLATVDMYEDLCSAPREAEHETASRWLPHRS